MTAVWAHRGASRVEPENTVAAFLRASAMGADGVELDVRRTGDATLAVHHDAVLSDGRPLVSLVGDELPDDVADLALALDACEGMVVNIELKNLVGEPDHDPEEGLAARVVTLLQRRERRDAVVVSSFSLASIDRVHALDASVATAWLVSGRSLSGGSTSNTVDLGRLVERCLAHGHVALHPHEAMVTAEIVERCHGAGLDVNSWTVDDPLRMVQLGELGVDALVTNVPDIAVRALSSRWYE